MASRARPPSPVDRPADCVESPHFERVQLVQDDDVAILFSADKRYGFLRIAGLFKWLAFLECRAIGDQFLVHRLPQSAGLVLQWLDEGSGRTWRKLPLLGQVEPESLAVYSEENTFKKIEERVDGNPEYNPKAIQVVQMLESEPSQSDPDKSSLLMEVFQMISDIAGSSALPLRSRQVVREEMREKHCTGSCNEHGKLDGLQGLEQTLVREMFEELAKDSFKNRFGQSKLLSEDQAWAVPSRKKVLSEVYNFPELDVASWSAPGPVDKLPDRIYHCRPRELPMEKSPVCSGHASLPLLPKTKHLCCYS
ncbi:unnamed protein product [Symbiodinium sp. KB8]|nr:unnamed protein product [Symbiodinium sp. KB8]